MTRVAFLGLGKMGLPMAANLLGAGFALTVWNRTRQRCEALAGSARVARTPREAVLDADVILYSLADDAAIEAVLFGEHGVLAGVRPGQLALDLGTVPPTMSRREARAFSERGVDFLDAPVFGSEPEAKAGGLWIVIGGGREAYERARPVLAPLSASTHYMGGTGAGASTGLLGSLIVAAQLQALGEALVLATKAGLRPQQVLDVLALPDFRSPIFSGMAGGIARRDFRPMFSLEHLHKDIDHVSCLARSLGVPIPASAVIRETLQAAMCQGWGQENASALVKALERQANVVIEEPRHDD